MKDLDTLPTAELELLRDNYVAAMEQLEQPRVGPAIGMSPCGLIATVSAPALVRTRVTEITTILERRRRDGGA